MARDSSPFARRLKALSSRAGRPADGADAGEPEADPSAAAATPASGPVVPPEPPRPAPADTPADEQPTGEFPALAVPSEPDEASTPLPDAAAPDPDDQPTTQIPAVSPIWLDPPAHDGGPEQERTDAVEWSSPAEDVLEPTTPRPEPTTGIHPIWEQDLAAGDDPYAPPAPDAEPDPPLDPAATAEEPAPAPDASEADPTRPVWLDEAQAVVPPPPHAATTGPADGDADVPARPTLSPPDLSGHGAEATPVDDPSLDATTPDEPQTTPAALHDALTLPDDEPAMPQNQDTSVDGEAAATGPEATAPEATTPAEPPTQVQDVVAPLPEPGGWRKRLGRRKATDEPVVADAPTEPEVRGDASASDATEPADDPSPSASSPESPPVTAAAPSGSTDPQGAATPDPGAPAADVPDTTEPGEDVAAPAGRFSAFGRRAKSLTGRRSEPTDPDAGPQTDRELERAAQAQAAETSMAPAQPVTAAVQERAEAPPVKPSFAERAALRRRVKSLRARRDVGLAELGAIVLDQSRFGDPTAGTLVRRRTTALADLDGEIAAIEGALDEDRSAETVTQLGIVHCTSCRALIGPVDRFCAQCGTARPEAGTADAPAADPS